MSEKRIVTLNINVTFSIILFLKKEFIIAYCEWLTNNNNEVRLLAGAIQSHCTVIPKITLGKNTIRDLIDNRYLSVKATLNLKVDVQS